jgi:hypothetical protein
VLLSLLSYKDKKELQVATFFSEIVRWEWGIGDWGLGIGHGKEDLGTRRIGDKGKDLL